MMVFTEECLFVNKWLLDKNVIIIPENGLFSNESNVAFHSHVKIVITVFMYTRSYTNQTIVKIGRQ